MTKLRRFFYHYHRHGEKQMTIHFKNKCIQVDNVICNVPCESKFRQIQPKLIMRGWASKVNVKDGVGIIQ
jgi:hypothetical protein